MIAYRALFVAVRNLVHEAYWVESERLSASVKELPAEALSKLERDGVPLTRKSWDPGKSRGRFGAR